MHKTVILALLGAILLPTAAKAMPAISCHCFQNREFDPQHPAAADRYLLTTTFNSFQALALGIEKKSIVRAKMSGQPSEDIWLRHWLANEAGRSIAWAERQRRGAGSWLKAAERLDLGYLKTLSSAPSSDQQLAAELARAKMKQYFKVGTEELTALQEKGASLKETVLSLFLASVAGKSPGQIFERAHTNGMTWGLVAQEAGVVFSTIEGRLGRMAGQTGK